MVVVTLTNFQQVESAVECFDYGGGGWGGGEAVLFELLPIIYVFVGINSFSESNSQNCSSI